jgi:hypothetical protein
LLSPVNPETKAKRCDRITFDAILWLDDDHDRASLLLTKPSSLAEQECAGEMIDRSTDFRVMADLLQKSVGCYGGSTISFGVLIRRMTLSTQPERYAMHKTSAGSGRPTSAASRRRF